MENEKATPQPIPPAEFVERFRANDWTAEDIPRLLATVNMLGLQASNMNRMVTEGVILRRLLGAVLKENFGKLKIDRRDINSLHEKFRVEIQETQGFVIVRLVEPPPAILMPGRFE